jgi:cytochrome c
MFRFKQFARSVLEPLILIKGWPPRGAICGSTDCEFAVSGWLRAGLSVIAIAELHDIDRSHLRCTCSVIGGGASVGQPRIWARRRVRQHSRKQFGLATIVLCASVSTASAQDVAAGQISFSRCLGCHSIGVDAKNKIGPQLNGLEGRKCGTVEGYAYSVANKECSFTWSEGNFVEYIRDPKAKIPGTRKSISGIRDQTEAKNLWAYLRQFGADGRPK